MFSISMEKLDHGNPSCIVFLASGVGLAQGREGTHTAQPCRKRNITIAAGKLLLLEILPLHTGNLTAEHVMF